METSITNLDFLDFKNDSIIKKIIGEEELLLSTKINKINSYGFSQERNFIITNKAIYYLKKKM